MKYIIVDTPGSFLEASLYERIESTKNTQEAPFAPRYRKIATGGKVHLRRIATRLNKAEASEEEGK